MFLADAVRTQPLHIAHRARFALGQRVGVEMQQRHAIEQLFRGVGPQFCHVTQVARRKTDVMRDPYEFIIVAGVESLAALADQPTVPHPVAKCGDE